MVSWWKWFHNQLVRDVASRPCNCFGCKQMAVVAHSLLITWKKRTLNYISSLCQIALWFHGLVSWWVFENKSVSLKETTEICWSEQSEGGYQCSTLFPISERLRPLLRRCVNMFVLIQVRECFTSVWNSPAVDVPLLSSVHQWMCSPTPLGCPAASCATRGHREPDKSQKSMTGIHIKVKIFFQLLFW